MQITLDKLETMTVADLEKLEKDIAIAKGHVAKKQRQKALEAAREVAATYGVDLKELLTEGAAVTKGKGAGRSNLPPKYRNPDDPAQVWSGRGRQPNWFKEKLDAGMPEDDMLV